jgi:hypothetical protein
MGSDDWVVLLTSLLISEFRIGLKFVLVEEKTHLQKMVIRAIVKKATLN